HAVDVVPHAKVNFALRKGARLARQYQALVDEVERLLTEVEVGGPDVRLLDKLRTKHPDHHIQFRPFRARQVGSGKKALTQRLAQLVRALNLAKQSGNLLQPQRQALAFQQEDGAVTQVPLKEDHQSIEQADNLEVRLEGVQAVEHRGHGRGI